MLDSQINDENKKKKPQDLNKQNKNNTNVSADLFAFLKVTKISCNENANQSAVAVLLRHV